MLNIPKEVGFWKMKRLQEVMVKSTENKKAMPYITVCREETANSALDKMPVCYKVAGRT